MRSRLCDGASVQVCAQLRFGRFQDALGKGCNRSERLGAACATEDFRLPSPIQKLRTAAGILPEPAHDRFHRSPMIPGGAHLRVSEGGCASIVGIA